MANLEPVKTFGGIIAAHFKHLDDNEYVLLVRPHEEGGASVSQFEIAQVVLHNGERVPAISESKNELYILTNLDRKLSMVQVWTLNIMPKFNAFLASKKKPGDQDGDGIPDGLTEVEEWVWFFKNLTGYNPVTGQFELK